MSRTYGLPLVQAGLLALLAVLVGLALPGASTAREADRTSGLSQALAPITQPEGALALARGAGYQDARAARRVEALQRLLARVGWRPGTPDGLFGPRTQAAVLGFQRAAGIAADGIVGPETAGRLLAANRQPLTRGAGYGAPAGSPRVRTLQSRLKARGLKPGPVDGMFGPRTQAAVERLQRSNGLDATGVVSRATRPFLLDVPRARTRTDQRSSLPARTPARRRSVPTRFARQTMKATKPDAVGATVGVATGEDDLLQPGLVVALALPLMLGAALVGVLVGRAGSATRAGRDPVVAEAAHSVPHSRPPRPVTTGYPAGTEQAPAPDAEEVRAIGYVSVPPGQSLRGSFMQAQMRAIDAACERHGWTLLEVVRDIERERGKASDRPGLTYALQSLARGDASCLIVGALPRLSPTVAELGGILKAIGRSGGRFVSLEDQIDTADPAGRKAANVIVSVSGWEHERLGERTRKGLAAARAKGAPISRPSVQDIPSLKEQIAAMRASGMTLQAIADTLNDDGVPTLRGGQKWRPSSVQAAAGYRRPKRGVR